MLTRFINRFYFGFLNLFTHYEVRRDKDYNRIVVQIRRHKIVSARYYNGVCYFAA